MRSSKRIMNLFHWADGRRLFIGLLLFLVLLPPDGLPWAARSAETFTAAATAASLQIDVPCTIEPNSGLIVPQGHTIPAVITLGPHSTVALLILVFTPEQLLAATTMRFQPGGIQVALRDVSFIRTEQIRYSTVLTIAPDAAPGVRDLNITIQTSPPIELFCSRAFTVETPEQSLEKANQTFRNEVAQALQQIARQTRVQIRTDNFVAIPLDDGSSVVVNAGIAGVENLTLEQLARGADVLFVFLRVPQGSGLPSGFYTVRIFQPGGIQVWKAQFKNLQGQVVLETDAEVGRGDPALQKLKLTGGIICDSNGCWIRIGWRGSVVKLRTSMGLGTGGPDPTPLPAAGQTIAQATGNFYQAARGVINTTKINTFRQVMIGTRDDVLVVQTAFQGVEKLTLEQLAQGQDVFFRYYGLPQGSRIPSGFYVVKVIRDNQSGKWVAQFRNMQGQVVLVKSAGVIKPAIQALRLLLEIESAGLSGGGFVLPDYIGVGVVLPAGIAVGDCNCTYPCPFEDNCQS